MSNCSSQTPVCFIIFPGGEPESGWGCIVLVTARTWYFTNSQVSPTVSSLESGKIPFITNTTSYKHIPGFHCQQVRPPQTIFDIVKYFRDYFSYWIPSYLFISCNRDRTLFLFIFSIFQWGPICLCDTAGRPPPTHRVPACYPHNLS